MLETMYVRCTHCGYDNSPEYRFCGMCGASLAHPPVAQSATSKEPSEPRSNDDDGETVHGPSFLGLAEDPKTEFHYLYEDEPPRSHAGLIFFLIVLMAAGGFGYWQWRHNGFPFNRLSGNTSVSSASASPSESAPAQTQDQQTHNDKAATGPTDVLPTAPDQKTQPSPPATQNGPSQPATSETPANAPAANQPTPAEAAPERTPSEGPSEKTEEAKATPPPEVTAKPRTAKASKRAPAPKEAAPVAPASTSPDADLELTGERYLYGNGVPRNCGRAETSLRAAALHGNSKAQTVLGTMYATGHCVGRDLPTAYRWFARALHQEPQNSRISADLQVLWRQMTPQEKQLATASGQ